MMCLTRRFRSVAGLVAFACAFAAVPMSASGQVFGVGGAAAATDASPGEPFTLDFTTTGPQAPPFDTAGFDFILTAPAFTTVEVQLDELDTVSFEPFSTVNGVSTVIGFLDDDRLQTVGGSATPPGVTPVLLPASWAQALTDGLVDVTLSFPGASLPQDSITFSASTTVVVPEPASAVALAVMATALAVRRRNAENNHEYHRSQASAWRGV